jgi:fructokinase
MKAWDIETTWVARHHGLQTGYVRASLTASRDARYEIATEVAWDQLSNGEDTIRAAYTARAIVFGSLALRSTMNRATLERLLPVLPHDAMRVFDVNLRPPHDDLNLVRDFARRATLLKLNTHEAARLAGGEPGFGREEHHARALRAAHGCPLVCITAAEHGAGLLAHDQWYWETGRDVKVEDTVGAGDAFLAMLIAQRLAGAPDPEGLARACRLGEWVATQRGATPAYELRETTESGAAQN